MSTQHTVKPTGFLAPQYVTGIYIPSALLMLITAVVKPSLLPVSAVVAVALGGYQFWSTRTSTDNPGMFHLARMDD